MKILAVPCCSGGATAAKNKTHPLGIVEKRVAISTSSHHVQSPPDSCQCTSVSALGFSPLVIPCVTDDKGGPNSDFQTHT